MVKFRQSAANVILYTSEKIGTCFATNIVVNAATLSFWELLYQSSHMTFDSHGQKLKPAALMGPWSYSELVRTPWPGYPSRTRSETRLVQLVIDDSACDVTLQPGP